MDDNEDNNDMIWCPDCSSVVLGEHNCSAFSNNFENKNDYLEALIAAVFERESLWNSALPYKFRGPSETKALWSEIDGCLNLYLHRYSSRYKPGKVEEFKRSVCKRTQSAMYLHSKWQ
nr:PREDICTED: uncharacterized protein LOC105670082 [Linepithema humile]